MIKMSAIGHLGKDAEVREVGQMRAIGFSIAHTERYVDRNGQPQEKTVWISCTLWRSPDKMGVVEYLTKGKQVYVEGTPSARAYMANDTAHASLDLRVDRLDLLSGGGKQDGGTKAKPQPKAQQQGGKGDDLPF